MLAFLLGLFRLIWLFGRGHHAVVLENLAPRQKLAIYKRKRRRPQLVGHDCWFWIVLSAVWRDWRKALFVVHPDTVVRWHQERFRRYWADLSKRSVRLGRPPIRSSGHRRRPGRHFFRIISGRWSRLISLPAHGVGIPPSCRSSCDPSQMIRDLARPPMR
jgi:hypothetical protein